MEETKQVSVQIKMNTKNLADLMYTVITHNAEVHNTFTMVQGLPRNKTVHNLANATLSVASSRETSLINTLKEYGITVLNKETVIT